MLPGGSLRGRARFYEERVIMNWPRIKTQPHEDRDNCFLPFDSKGPLRYDSEQ